MTQSYGMLRGAAEAALSAARVELNRVIAAYPTPIAGCDAQFEHLLAERRRLGAALRALGGGDATTDRP